MKKAINWIDEYLEEVLLVAALAAMAVIMGVQVFCRYVLGASLSWSEELTRYIFIWAGFLSVSYCTKKCISIKIEQFVALFPKRGKAMFKVVNHTFELILFFYLIPFAVEISDVRRGKRADKSGYGDSDVLCTGSAPGRIYPFCDPCTSEVDRGVQFSAPERRRVRCRLLFYLLFLSCAWSSRSGLHSLGIVSVLPGAVDPSFTASATYVIRSMLGGLDSFPLLAVPMFVLSGIIMARGGISRKLFDVFAYFMGKRTAGMPVP